MNLIIKSRKLGKTFEFSRPGSHYVYVQIDGGQPMQICYGGGFMGSTMACPGASELSFEDVCRYWYRDHIRRQPGDDWLKTH